MGALVYGGTMKVYGGENCETGAACACDDFTPAERECALQAVAIDDMQHGLFDQAYGSFLIQYAQVVAEHRAAHDAGIPRA